VVVVVDAGNGEAGYLLHGVGIGPVDCMEKSIFGYSQILVLTMDICQHVSELVLSLWLGRTH
jgi:hypothetical protein